MNVRKSVFLFGFFVLFCSRALGSDVVCLDEIVVTGTRTGIDKSKIGKSITVVEDIAGGYYSMLSENIRDVEGVRVKRVDGDAGLTTIRIRGARSVDTLLLFDGMPFSDPSDPQGSSNPLIGDIGSSGFEKIEVLRGPSSSIYGSSAQGGVVNMLTDETQGFTVKSEFGSDNTFREMVGGGVDLKEYGSHNVFFERVDSDGFDAHDDYEKTQVVGKSKLEFGENWNGAISYLFGRTDAALNSSPSIKGGELKTGGDDENDTREYQIANVLGSVSGELSDAASIDVKASFLSSERRFTFLPNEDGSGFLSDGTFGGDAFTLQENLTFEHNEMFTTVVGHQYRREWLTQKTFLDGQVDFFGTPLFDMDDETDQFSNDFFIEEAIEYKRLTVLLSARENMHESAKSRLAWDASASYIFPSFTVLRAHAGTAYREPSLFELFGSFLSSFGRFEVGNEGLSPERSFGYDFGFEHPWSRGSFGSTFFESKISNKIDFVGFGYENVPGDSKTHGVESFFSFDITDEVNARVSHTMVTGEDLIDIPKHEIGAKVSADFGKFKSSISGLWVGDHKILVFDEDTFLVDKIDEKGHFIASAQVSYDLTQNITVYVRGENVLNEDYNDGGYNVPGARVYGGVIASF